MYVVQYFMQQKMYRRAIVALKNSRNYHINELHELYVLNTLNDFSLIFYIKKLKWNSFTCKLAYHNYIGYTMIFLYKYYFWQIQFINLKNIQILF